MNFSSLAVMATRAVKAHPVNGWMSAFCVCVLVLGAPLAVSAATQAAPDSAQIAQVMKAEFDRPGQPLSVDPVSVEGAFAIAGWSQGGNGGRALLQRTGANWQIVLCAGDALLQPATLTGAGMAQDAATRLVANVLTAESHLTTAQRQQFASFAGVMKVTHAPGGLSVSNAWARATPTGVAVGAAYFMITNHGKQSDTLESITSPVAAMVELHQSTVEGGLSRMRPAAQVVIEPGQTVNVAPGGLHAMLTDLKSPLVAGTKVPLVLNFRHAGAMTVQMDVQPLTSMTNQGLAGH